MYFKQFSDRFASDFCFEQDFLSSDAKFLFQTLLNPSLPITVVKEKSHWINIMCALMAQVPNSKLHILVQGTSLLNSPPRVWLKLLKVLSKRNRKKGVKVEPEK